VSALPPKAGHVQRRHRSLLSATSGRRDFGFTHNLRLRCFGPSAPNLHRPFSHSHAGPADVILTNKFTAGVLKGGPDRPHCTWPKRLPALKSGNGVRGYLCGPGQITHALSQCSAGHSALYRQQFVTRFRLDQIKQIFGAMWQVLRKGCLYEKIRWRRGRTEPHRRKVPPLGH